VNLRGGGGEVGFVKQADFKPGMKERGIMDEQIESLVKQKRKK